MAKKAKTPTPPRRVQAPKQRTGTRRPDTRGAGVAVAGGDRRLLLLVLFAASGVVMLIAVIGFLFLAGGDEAGDSKVRQQFEAAGCTYKTVAPKPFAPGTVHVPDGTPVAKMKWNTWPPAGGAHYGSPAIWNFWTDPVDPRRVVHNEEHGGVVLWWGPQVPQSTVAKLRAFYDEDAVSMIGTPLQGFGKKVAITAWTGDPKQYNASANYMGEAHVGICTTFGDEQEKAFATFRGEFKGKGPEGVPMDVNQPNT